MDLLYMVSDLVDLFHYQRHRKWAFLHPLGRVPWFFKNSGCGQQGMNSYHFIALGILNLSFCLDFERCSLVVGSVVSLMIQLLFQVRILDMKSTKTQLNLTFKFPSLQQKKNFSHWPQQKGRKLVEQKVAVTWPQGRPSVCNYHHLISMHHMIKT